MTLKVKLKHSSSFNHRISGPFWSFPLVKDVINRTGNPRGKGRFVTETFR